MDQFKQYLAQCPNGSGLDPVARVQPAKWVENLDGAVGFIAILDGSDLYAERHGSSQAEAKEDFHYQLCRRMVLSRDGRILERQDCSRFYRDAVFAAFEGGEASRNALCVALAVHRYLGAWNEEHELGWEAQVHTRIGISASSWKTTLALSQQAQRKEVVLAEELWGAFSVTTRLLLRAAANVRDGLPADFWAALRSRDWGTSSAGTPPMSRSIVVARKTQEIVAQMAEYDDPPRNDEPADEIEHAPAVA